jgi:hypothetical protein
MKAIRLSFVKRLATWLGTGFTFVATIGCIHNFDCLLGVYDTKIQSPDALKFFFILALGGVFLLIVGIKIPDYYLEKYIKENHLRF